MKAVSIILLLIASTSCGEKSDYTTTQYAIRSIESQFGLCKYYCTPLINGSPPFSYSTNRHFVDSCYKYSLLDTLNLEQYYSTLKRCN